MPQNELIQSEMFGILSALSATGQDQAKHSDTRPAPDPHTIEAERREIIRRLGVTDLADAVAQGLRNKLIE